MRWGWTGGLLSLLMAALAACQGAVSPSAPPPTYTPFPTYTPYPTYTPNPTYTPYPSPSQSNLPSAELENMIWPTGPRDDVIPVADAADFMGSQVTVEGIVSRTHNSGNAVFLNFDHNGQEVFTAVIFPDDWSKFPAPPETLFAGKLVRVEGIIEAYQDKPEIIINEPYQIEVALTLGQPVVTDCNCAPPTVAANSPPLPTATPSFAPVVEPAAAPPAEPAGGEAATPPVLSWQDAANFEGQTVTVAGRVVDTHNSGKTVFLNFDQDYRTSFKVVIFSDAWPQFSEPPEQLFRDKAIEVTGQIKIYQNAPEIIVDHPTQIKILE